MTLFRLAVWLNDPKHFNIVFGGSLAAFRPRLSNGLPCQRPLSAKDVFRSAQIGARIVLGRSVMQVYRLATGCCLSVGCPGDCAGV